MRNNRATERKNQEVLNDQTPSGRKRPWVMKKRASVKLSESFKRLGEEGKAYRVLGCGAILVFDEAVKEQKRLVSANFCRERLCPMCAWRRSLKVFSQVSDVMNLVFDENPTLVPLFLTLTIKNTDSEGLHSALDMIFSGWKKVFKIKVIENVVVGWFRALEVTRNSKNDTYHPHIHAILLVRRGYFNTQDYIKTSDWVQLWRQCLQIDYDPVCDIRRIKTPKNTEMSYKTIAEVSKYTVKDTDYIVKDTAKTDEIVSVLGKVLKGRRLYAFGGICKEAAKRLRLDAEGDGDLIHIDKEYIRSDIAEVLVKYRWNIGVGNYVREG